jgi:hypothetical protein
MDHQTNDKDGIHPFTGNIMSSFNVLFLDRACEGLEIGWYWREIIRDNHTYNGPFNTSLEAWEDAQQTYPPEEPITK